MLCKQVYNQKKELIKYEVGHKSTMTMITMTIFYLTIIYKFIQQIYNS